VLVEVVVVDDTTKGRTACALAVGRAVDASMESAAASANAT
jgi:hypothetical protein